MPEPSNDERTTETPVVESPASAGSAPDELPDLIDALRADQAEKTQAASNDDEQDDDDEEEPEAAEQSPPQADQKPDAAPTAERRLTRGERRQQELEQAHATAARHRQEADELRASIAKANQEAIAQLGSDDEFKRLAAKRADPRQTLGYDEEIRYTELFEKREQAATWYSMADKAVRMSQQQSLASAAVKFDLPPDELLQAPDPAVLIERVVQRTEARVRDEQKDTIARLEADNQSLLSRIAGKSKDPGVGGRSAAGRADMPSWDDAEPMDYFKVKREAAGANHR